MNANQKLLAVGLFALTATCAFAQDAAPAVEATLPVLDQIADKIPGGTSTMATVLALVLGFFLDLLRTKGKEKPLLLIALAYKSLRGSVKIITKVCDLMMVIMPTLDPARTEAAKAAALVPAAAVDEQKAA